MRFKPQTLDPAKALGISNVGACDGVAFHIGKSPPRTAVWMETTCSYTDTCIDRQEPTQAMRMKVTYLALCCSELLIHPLQECVVVPRLIVRAPHVYQVHVIPHICKPLITITCGTTAAMWSVYLLSFASCFRRKEHQ